MTGRQATWGKTARQRLPARLDGTDEKARILAELCRALAGHCCADRSNTGLGNFSPSGDSLEVAELVMGLEEELRQ